MAENTARNTRQTKQKRVILEALRQVTSHPTADEVYQMARERIPNISLGTVYRNLEQLSEQGMIRKLPLAGSQMRFDGRAYQHHHVRCVRCERVDDVISVRGNPGRIDVEAAGYTILGHRIEFYGLCPDCQDKENR
jgi:Fur family ferric uptake transcriptional regulator